MRRPSALVPTLLLLAALPAALAAPQAPGTPPRQAVRPDQPVSAVVYPDQQLPLHFSHARHLAIAGVDCETCHETAARSRSSLDSLVPGEDRCRACHAIDRAQPRKAVPAGAPPAHCAACHPGAVAGGGIARVVIPTARIKFDHRAHRSVAGCRDCHGDLAAEKVDLATRKQLPSMSLCLRCHDGRRASDRCTTCHLTRGGGRIETDFPGGRLAPSGALRGNDAHGPTFRTDHAAAARADQGYCASCHRQSECVDCHQGTIKPLDFHGNDYVSTHALDARRGTPDCSACHRAQTFCVGCHSRSGVAADGKGSEFAPPPSGGAGPRYHPAGWVDYAAGNPVSGDATRGENHHAFEAQRNIRQCAACHRESFCLTCHSAQPGAPRIDPHPEGWRGSRRCEALLRRARRMCLRCHTDAAEITCQG
jgi:c(7)-type cytochrome triheme protein